MKTVCPPYLNQGDAIALIAPAKYIDVKRIDNAVRFFESWRLRVRVGKSVLSAPAFFSAPDELRLKDFQEALDDRMIKAIVCARGGYGSLRILDQLDFTEFVKYPKWIVGYSDITAIQVHVGVNYGVASMHGEMPLKYPDFPSTDANLQSLQTALFGQPYTIAVTSQPENRCGHATGKLVGGNLSMLCSLLGSRSFPDLKDCILFLEDVDEQLYQIDRLLLSLQRVGVFHKITGLVLGQFTDIHDNTPSFGKNVEAMIGEKLTTRNYPVMFNLPSGHTNINKALILGAEHSIEVNEKRCTLTLL
ncbi:peptidase S66 [Bacteroidia bacterium]|nr:peptidase S66 [Bacteroidia bacterium]